MDASNRIGIYMRKYTVANMHFVITLQNCVKAIAISTTAIRFDGRKNWSRILIKPSGAGWEPRKLEMGKWRRWWDAIADDLFSIGFIRKTKAHSSK